MTDYHNILDYAPDQHDTPANMPGDMFPLLFPSENWALAFLTFAVIGFFFSLWSICAIISYLIIPVAP